MIEISRGDGEAEVNDGSGVFSHRLLQFVVVVLQRQVHPFLAVGAAHQKTSDGLSGQEGVGLGNLEQHESLVSQNAHSNIQRQLIPPKHWHYINK